ncbi:hypothetical protein AAD001_04660 [Colwelliaceae bacterium 6471]
MTVYPLSVLSKLIRISRQLMLSLLIVIIFPSQAFSNPQIDYLANAPSIAQDKQGFIWIASHKGLLRYDGSNTINFSNNNKTWPIPFTWIHNISLNNGKLIISSESRGLWEFDPKSAQVAPINVDSESKTIYNAIHFKGKYYVYSPNNLYSFTPSNSTTQLLAKNTVLRDIKHTGKYLYFSSHKGLYRLVDSRLELIIGDSINAIESVGNGLVAITENSIHYIDDDNNSLTIPVNAKINTITREFDSDNFYILTEKGKIEKYHALTLRKLTHDYPSVKPTRARAIFHDSSGVLWILDNLGVQQLSTVTTKNHPLVFDIANNANEIELLDNQIIIGSYGQGLHNFNGNVLNKGANNALSTKAKKTMDLLTIGSDVYIASFDGLWRYSLANKTAEPIDFTTTRPILLKLKEKDKLLYIASNDLGFYIYDLNTQTIIEHVNEGLSSKEVIDILPVDDGNIWLATSLGVDIFNRSSKTIKNLDIPGPGKVISLQLADNKIFAATKGDGMFVFNKQGELLARFAVAVNFNHMAIFNNEIWAPATHGLYRIVPETYRITMVPDTEQYSFTDRPVLLNDKLYIPHYGGVLEVPLTVQNKFQPNVYISKTIISGQEYLLNKSIDVDSPNDVITLELASLDFRPGQEKQFKYQINGGIWHPVSGNQLTLTGMASGTYKIEIMATNSMGEWSNNRAYTEIHVAYPWYWTPQIRVLYAITVFSIICMTIWLLYLRARSISHIHQLLAVDIKNRGKVALNVSQKLTIADQLLTENHENSNTEKIKQLLTQSITELNTNLKSTEPNSLYGNSLLVALPYLSDYIHKKYHININHKLNIDENNINDEMQADIYKIIYEAINSAILNGDGRNFTITLQEFKHKLWINIGDDANSFTQFKSKINFDMAMYYIRQIANKYNASINTFEEDDNGSQLVIIIPLMDIS